ncbi:unnamed protein product, partial [Prorocentrum cordatum]
MAPAFVMLPVCLYAIGSMSPGAEAKEHAVSGNRRFLAKAQSEGQQCGSSGSDGHFYGDCSSGLECVAPAAGPPVGAPSTCQKVGQQVGQQCGSSGSDGHFYGDCSPGLACVPPWALPASATRCAAASGPTGTMSMAPAARARRVLARPPRLAGSGLASATCTATALIADLRRAKGSNVA